MVTSIPRSKPTPSRAVAITQRFYKKHMKILRSLLLALFIGLTISTAEEVMPLPDLSKAFPTEKLFTQTKLAGIEVYAYATNHDFATLKKELQVFLGEGWTEVKVNPVIEKVTNETIKAQGVEMEGNTLFSHPEYPHTQIGLTQMKMDLVGKKFIANITVVRNKAEQGSAEQQSTRSQSKSEDHQKP